MRTRLTEDETKGVLSRAEDIHLHSITGSDSDVVIRAAEEAGLPREAIEQALREQFDRFSEPLKVGDLVFARSSDERHYVAEVTGQTESGFKVRFLKGGEGIVALQHLRPCAFLPGEELVVNWPGWGWWKVSVVSYDAAARVVRASDGWYEKQFSIADVRVDPPKKPREVRRATMMVYVALLAGGSAIGALITWLMMR